MKINSTKLKELGMSEVFIRSMHLPQDDSEVEIESLIGEVSDMFIFFVAERTLDRNSLLRLAFDCVLLNVDYLEGHCDQFEQVKHFLQEPEIADAENVYLQLDAVRANAAAKGIFSVAIQAGVTTHLVRSMHNLSCGLLSDVAYGVRQAATQRGDDGEYLTTVSKVNSLIKGLFK